MTGPSFTMAPAIEARTAPLHGSNSLSDLSHVASGMEQHAQAHTRSLTSTPNIPSLDIDFDSDLDTSLAFEKTAAAKASDEARLQVPGTFDAFDKAVARRGLETKGNGHFARLKRTPVIERPSSWFPRSPNTREWPDEARSRTAGSQLRGAKAKRKDGSPKAPEKKTADKTKKADWFTRRSWMPGSRSPSPAPRKTVEKTGDGLSGDERRRPKSRTRLTRRLTMSPDSAKLDQELEKAATGAVLEVASCGARSRALNRASMYLGFRERPSIAVSRSSPALLSRQNGADTSSPPTWTAPKTESLAMRCMPRSSSHTASSTTSDTTGSNCEDSSQSSFDTKLTMPCPTPHDPLWFAFRNLDEDFHCFQAKTTTSGRMLLVRSSLVPFLHKTALHHSNHSRDVISPEDVDRRATILHRWWNGLLEMLDGGHSRHVMTATKREGLHKSDHLQPVAGVDRPTLLETTTMVMMRPEWRLYTSHFQPLAERGHGSAWACEAEGVDFDMSPSSFLAQSAEHNVRNMFVSNLLTQMALIIDKMSQRHASLSLVNWCGKACAYAFFFAPGVADMLVRLWPVTPDLIRRVAGEFGLPRPTKAGRDAADSRVEQMVSNFPPGIKGLGCTSAKKLIDALCTAPSPPLTVHKIAWRGPWLSRWRGGETDLMYIFCKYYHILCEQFMGPSLSLADKARAPGFLLVHAQLLGILDTTIHRQASLDAAFFGLGPVGNGQHGGVNASLVPVPHVPTNLLRQMHENRLIILLKDMVSENSPVRGGYSAVTAAARHLFAQSFVRLMKAATKRTSRHEHAAHFVLCDFLEEALRELDGFEKRANGRPVKEEGDENDGWPPKDDEPAVDCIDWPFWLDVVKKMLASNNTLSEIRTVSLLFSLWGAMSLHGARKETICVDWLLTELTFDCFFNHWSPMVRAYYMRLVCWRICRDEGRHSELDVRLFLLVAKRLKTVWSHYLWLKQQAEAEGRLPPSTSPCLPQPGKALVISSSDVLVPQPGLLLGFDAFSSAFPSGLEPLLASRSNCNRSSVSFADTETTLGHEKVKAPDMTHKKRWSLLGKLLSLSAAQSVGSKRTRKEELERARRQTAEARVKNGNDAANGLDGLKNTQPIKKPATRSSPASCHSAASIAHSDSGSSTGSSPVFDAVKVVYHFSLATPYSGYGSACSGPRLHSEDTITCPRLPAPAQARVSSVLNKGASLGSAVGEQQASVRSVSLGLVSGASNAPAWHCPPDAPSSPSQLSLSSRHPSLDSFDDALELTRTDHPASPTGSAADRHGRKGRSSGCGQQDAVSEHVMPTKPTGAWARGAVYAGRALAEWAGVVSDCNSFIEQRRRAGVLDPRHVEVPTLSIEGMGGGGGPSMAAYAAAGAMGWAHR